MITYPNEPSGDVLVLGAGFSHSLSELMPVTDGLGTEVVSRAVATCGLSGFNLPDHFTCGSFEAWLSRIAEAQPDLTPSENSWNRYVFDLCSKFLAEVLAECVKNSTEAVIGNSWLLDLLHALHATRATVITFNQDVLVELAVNAAGIASWDRRNWRPGNPQPGIGRNDVLGGVPARPPGWLPWEPPRPSFRLLKLHGSTNWFWQPGDFSGATTVTWTLPGEDATDETDLEATEERSRALLGRVPMIVPPSAAKSMFYKSPLLTKLWQDARGALQIAAGSIYLVGYSLPLTDLVTVGMLRETIGSDGGNSAVPVTVINPDPAPVVQALTYAGVAEARISTIATVDAFSGRYLQSAAKRLAAFVHLHLVGDEQVGLLVGTSLSDARKVSQIGHDDVGNLTLELMDESYVHSGTNQSEEGASRLCTTKDLRATLDAISNVRAIIISAASSPYRVIIAATEHVADVGAGSGRWQVLITTRSR